MGAGLLEACTMNMMYQQPVFVHPIQRVVLKVESLLFFMSVSVWSSGVSPVSAPASNSKLVNLPRLFFKIAENLPFLTQGGLIMQSCRNSADMQAMFDEDSTLYIHY